VQRSEGAHGAFPLKRVQRSEGAYGAFPLKRVQRSEGAYGAWWMGGQVGHCPHAWQAKGSTAAGHAALRLLEHMHAPARARSLQGCDAASPAANGGLVDTAGAF